VLELRRQGLAWFIGIHWGFETDTEFNPDMRREISKIA
jgi:hypothetical protein